ncbi:MAG TPA: hypothetical protein VLD67_13955 [Vicinamibacterales bacterium]|nr:hypothetical protein [Vicinamibacterales bacterium]
MICRSAVVFAVVLVGVAGAPAAPQQVIRSGVDAVTIDVSVTQRNRPVEGLAARDFELTDNGVRQTILDVSRDTLPIDVTLVVDMSGRGVLQPSLVAGVNRVLKSLRPGDRARIVTFRSHVREVAALAEAGSLAPLEIGPGVYYAVSPSGATACYDAVALSILTPPAPGRRQLAIVFSAGRDTSSFLAPSDLLAIARRSGPMVSVVHASFDLTPGDEAPEGAEPLATPVDPLAITPRFFEELADATGGRVEVVRPFRVQRHDTKSFSFRWQLVVGLEDSFVRALDDFRSAYVLRYTPEGVGTGGWHEVAVRVTKAGGQYEVRARKGYER